MARGMSAFVQTMRAQRPSTNAGMAGGTQQSSAESACKARLVRAERQSQRMGRAWRHHGMTLSAPGIAGCSRARGVAVAWDVHLV